MMLGKEGWRGKDRSEKAGTSWKGRGEVGGSWPEWRGGHGNAEMSLGRVRIQPDGAEAPEVQSKLKASNRPGQPSSALRLWAQKQTLLSFIFSVKWG